MRKKHHASLKLHTIYTLVLAVTFGVVLYFTQDLTLGISMVFLLFYVVGNGIIHARKNVLHRDTLLEYILVSAIVLALIIGYIT